MEEILPPSSPDDADTFPGANLLSIPGVEKKTLAAMLSAVGFEGGAFDSGIKLVGHKRFLSKDNMSQEKLSGITKYPEDYQNISATAFYYGCCSLSLNITRRLRPLTTRKSLKGKASKQALIAYS